VASDVELVGTDPPSLDPAAAAGPEESRETDGDGPGPEPSPPEGAAD
jgi:hypothetical protein